MLNKNKVDSTSFDDRSYIEYLESIIYYADKALHGDYDSIKEHKFIPIENALANINKNKEARRGI